jgi:hypothetical protein
MPHAQASENRRLSFSAVIFTALLLSSLPLLAGCGGGETQDQVLRDHSGLNPDSIYRHHHNN